MRVYAHRPRSYLFVQLLAALELLHRILRCMVPASPFVGTVRSANFDPIGDNRRAVVCTCRAELDPSGNSDGTGLHDVRPPKPTFWTFCRHKMCATCRGQPFCPQMRTWAAAGASSGLDVAAVDDDVGEIVLSTLDYSGLCRYDEHETFHNVFLPSVTCGRKELLIP